MGKIIGIDLGTTNSVVAVMEGGEATVITTAEGLRLCPSVVAFDMNGERLVGAPAKRQAVVNPENTVSSIKRFMGRRYNEVVSEGRKVPFRLEQGLAGDARVNIPVNNRVLTPQEVSAMILAKLKTDAEAYLGEEVKQAVITVPAYFNDSQRQATKDAGKIAGLDVLRIINEPTASALAYGLDKQHNEKILVFDLGGGTFDVSVLEVGDGVFEVKSTRGDTHLGGDDWDGVIVDHIVSEFKSRTGINLRKDRQALQRLREAAEKAKIELSTLQETEINLPYVTANTDGPKHLEIKLSRAEFEKMTAHLLERIREPFNAAIQDAGFAPDEIEELVLVGGATRMPMVQKLVQSLIGKEPNKGVNPDEVVALGAAIQAGVLAGEVKDVLLLDVTPLSLGIETLGGVMTTLIERNTTIPVRKTQVFSTAVDNQSAVDVHVLQGERPMAVDNMTLGRFRLDGIPSARRGIPQIEVTYDIDVNGILKVSARDKATGSEQQVQITASTNLYPHEIEKLVQEAKQHQSEDAGKREKAEVSNMAEMLIYEVEKAWREQNEPLPEETQGKIDELRKAAAGDDLAEIRRLTAELQRELQQELQKNDQTQPGQPDQQNIHHADANNPDVIDGEFNDA